MIIPRNLATYAIGPPCPVAGGGWRVRFRYFEKPGPVAVMKAFERGGYVVRRFECDGAQTTVDVKFFKDERDELRLALPDGRLWAGA